MENLENLNLTELKQAELSEIEGGGLFLFLIGMGIGWIIAEEIWG